MNSKQKTSSAQAPNKTQPEEFDWVILGGGTGSTIAAWTFARDGKRIAVVDRKYIGGRCPNIACLAKTSSTVPRPRWTFADARNLASPIKAMGLSWQQGPLSPGTIGRFLVPEQLPKRLLYAEPLRRRIRVRFGGTWIVDSENVLLLFEPGHYPITYFPETDVSPNARHRA